MLRRAASFAAILLMLLTAAPVMACVADLQRSQADKDCCQAMHGKCGEMAKTGCCHVEVGDQQPQLATHASAPSFHWVAIAVVVFNLATPQPGIPARWLAPDEHSPPLPQSARPAVLRL